MIPRIAAAVGSRVARMRGSFFRHDAIFKQRLTIQAAAAAFERDIPHNTSRA